MATSDDEAGQVLPNLPGLTDPAELAHFERRMAAARIWQLEVDPGLAGGDFDFAHLQSIHAYILQDVYPWAGHIRSATQDTTAMGLAHCRPQFIPNQLGVVFGAIERHRPSPADPDLATATVAEHWGELTAVHPFRDGNSRSQRVFFNQYLADAGWDIDWTQVNASAVHAARHIAMATTDSTFLAAELRPGVVPFGTAPALTLSRTEGHRDTRTAVQLFEAMKVHKRAGLPASSFQSAPTSPRPDLPGTSSAVTSAALRAARLAGRDHPTAAREAAARPTTDPTQQANPNRRPAHYRRDPGRDNTSEAGYD